MKIERFVHLNRLYSIYKDVLTDKQKEILSLLLEEDYSLGEVSDEIGISRQAVHDTIKRTEKAFQFYEDTIGMFRYEEKVSSKVERLLQLVQSSKALSTELKLQTEMINICEELLS